MSRAERAAGLEMWQQMIPMFQYMTQKQKIYVAEMTGFPTDSNPETLQIQKANRDIQKIIAGDQEVVPNLLYVDLPIYIKTFREYLASKDGDMLAEENEQAFNGLIIVLTTALQMMNMAAGSGVAGFGGGGGPDAGPQPGGGGPSGPSGPPNAPGGSKGPAQLKAQAPVAEDKKVDMPPLPSMPMGVQ